MRAGGGVRPRGGAARRRPSPAALERLWRGVRRAFATGALQLPLRAPIAAPPRRARPPVALAATIRPSHHPTKRLTVSLNAGRVVSGTLRGFDQFSNIVLDAAVDERAKTDIGMVVIRGASISTLEALEPAGG